MTVVPDRAAPAYPVHFGRRILVTGGAQGIGAATVERLVDEGARVAIVDIDELHAEDLTTRLGERVEFVSADVGDLARLGDAVSECVRRLGGLDAVVSNAGIVRILPAEDHTAMHWHEQLDVNLVGAFEIARAALPHLRASPSGAHVVFVSSESGKRGHIDMVAYNATKAAIINMARVLAEEWAPDDINVNAVCPGGVATRMLRDVADHYARGDDAKARALLAGMAVPRLGRHVTTDEVARVISFLLSPGAQAIRGQAINVDGGDAPY